MKLRTDQTFGGKQVRLGDRAIVCVTRRELSFETHSWREVAVPHAVDCVDFDDDNPVWCVVGELGSVFQAATPKFVRAQFVENEADLAPGRWTW